LALAALALVTCGGPRAETGVAPHKLVVLASTDMKGKTSPCGCHIPKGGFARIATVVDSTRSAGPTLYVDAGGAFPDQDGRSDLPEFMLASLVGLKAGAIGVGPRDLGYGVALLRELARRTGAPITCANLLERRTRAPLFPTSLLLDVAGTRVG